MFQKILKICSLHPLLLGIVLFITMGGGYYLYKQKGSHVPQGGMPAGFAMPVEAVRVKQETLDEMVQTVGTLKADESVIIRPEVTGRISKIHFKEGQKVNKNDLLFTFDDSTRAALVAESEASMELSQAKNERQKSLFKNNFTSGGKRDEAISKLKVDEAILKRRKVELDKTRITAPFEGVLGLRTVSPGDYVQEGQDMVNLVKLNPLKVEFSLPDLYINTLKEDQRIEMTSEAFPEVIFHGYVTAIDPVVNENGRNVHIKAELSNSDFILKPGMFVRIRVILASHKDALLIPEEAIIPQKDDQFVYKIDQGKAKRINVRLGIRKKGWVEVRSGLRVEDEVITAGQIKIGDGMPVQNTMPIQSQKP